MSDNKEYKAGDVVVWSGIRPAILRIKEDFKVIESAGHWRQCASATYQPYSSMHYTRLRLATQAEIERLGNEQVWFLPSDPENA